MPTPFGPQLIGETEKTLNALLHQVLAGRLTEPEWVTLRLAHLLEGEVASADQLVAAVSDRARFDHAAGLVRGLTAEGLLQDGRPTDRARALVADLQERIAVRTAPIWRDLPAEDVAATERVLVQVRDRARAQLAALRSSPAVDRHDTSAYGARRAAPTASGPWSSSGDAPP